MRRHKQAVPSDPKALISRSKTKRNAWVADTEARSTSRGLRIAHSQGTSNAEAHARYIPAPHGPYLYGSEGYVDCISRTERLPLRCLLTVVKVAKFRGVKNKAQ